MEAVPIIREGGPGKAASARLSMRWLRYAGYSNVACQQVTNACIETQTCVVSIAKPPSRQSGHMHGAVVFRWAPQVPHQG